MSVGLWVQRQAALDVFTRQAAGKSYRPAWRLTSSHRLRYGDKAQCIRVFCAQTDQLMDRCIKSVGEVERTMRISIPRQGRFQHLKCGDVLNLSSVRSDALDELFADKPRFLECRV